MIAMERFKSQSSIISYHTNKQLEERINSLGASAKMEMTIKPTYPRQTTTAKAVEVFYYKETSIYE